MKTCSKCKLGKPDSDFNKKGNKLHTFCRKCQNAYSAEHYQNNREVYRDHDKVNKTALRTYRRRWVDTLKSKPCVDCGIQYPPHIMDFDHLRDKYKSISQMIVNGCTDERILEEVAKCEVVCSNCHRERTYQRQKKT